MVQVCLKNQLFSATLLVLSALHGGGHSCELSVGSFAFSGCKSPIREATIMSGDTREQCVADSHLGRSFNWHCDPNGGGVIFDYYSDSECSQLSETATYGFPGCQLEKISGFYIRLSGDCCTDIDNFVAAEQESKQEEEEEAVEEAAEETADDNSDEDSSEDGKPSKPDNMPEKPKNGTISREELKHKFERGAGISGQLFAKIRALSKSNEEVFRPMEGSNKGVNSAHVIRDFMGFKPKDKSMNFNTARMNRNQQNSEQDVKSMRSTKDLYRTLYIDEE